MSSKLSALGKRKLARKAPTTVALNKKNEVTKPKEKIPVDLAYCLEDSLEMLTEEQYRALCRLAMMPLKLLVPLLQVANRPGMKESIAHLATWKQVQHCFRQFCPTRRLRSLRDNDLLRLERGLPRVLPSNICPEKLTLFKIAKERERRFPSNDTGCWDMGVGNKLPFIEDKYGFINWHFFTNRGLYDPLVAEENKERELKLDDDYIFFDTLWHFGRSIIDSYTFCLAYTDEEVRNMRKSHQFVFYLKIGSLDANNGLSSCGGSYNLTSEELNKYFYLSHEAPFYRERILDSDKEKQIPIYKENPNNQSLPVEIHSIRYKRLSQG